MRRARDIKIERVIAALAAMMTQRIAPAKLQTTGIGDTGTLLVTPNDKGNRPARWRRPKIKA
jgi:hypothetical protein